MGNAQPVVNGMQAAQYKAHSQDYSKIKVVTVKKPKIRKSGYALVRIHASSLNPADDKLFKMAFLPESVRGIGFFQWMIHTFIWPVPFPMTPGYEFSGVIEEVSADVTNFKVGDEVYALNWGTKHHQDGVHPVAGGFAEYTAIRISALLKKPANMSHALAAAHPMVATSADQAIKAIKMTAGQKVLILGGSSALGVTAVQLAKLRGAWVATTCSPRTVQFVQQFGADQIIDYTTKKWWLQEETGLSDFDIVLDCVGGPENSLKNAETAGLIKHGGVFCSMANIDAGFNQYTRTPRFAFAGFFPAVQDHQSMEDMQRLVQEGKLKIPIEATYPFTQQGVTGIFNKVGGGKSMGKNVLQIVPE